jgi:hypothetical protein
MYTNCSVRLYVTRVDRGRVCRWAQEFASCCVNHLHALIIDEFIQLMNSFTCYTWRGSAATCFNSKYRRYRLSGNLPEK